MKRTVIFSISIFSLTIAFSCCNNKSTNSDQNNSNGVSQNIVDIPATAQGPANGKLPKIVFADTNFDFGDIKEGDKVTHVFVFRNEGQGDLVISGASASCGCTRPEYPHNVKHPGDTGTISVTFDSSNKTGKVTKSVTVMSNCQPPYKFLTINANIQPLNK